MTSLLSSELNLSDQKVEVWKAIPGYEGFYEASSLGRIRSIDRVRPFRCSHGFEVDKLYKGKMIIPHYDGKNNYLHVNLSKDGKSATKSVHRLIAMTFIDNPDSLPEINHKDENKTNNAVSNLEWCDRSYNNKYGNCYESSLGENNPMNKISEKTVLKIKEEYIPRDKEFGVAGLSRKYGLSQTHVCAILKGRRWGWLNAPSGS